MPMGNDLLAYIADPTMPMADADVLPLEGLTPSAPITRPGKIVCIGFNYRDHAAEAKFDVPSEPPMFSKFANSIIGAEVDVVVPADTEQPDYEAELAVIIGRTAKCVDSVEAMDYVFGYTCANDVSARDLQSQNLQWLRGKAVDTFLPMGPVLVTRDEIPDPQNLAIRLLLNGEEMQRSNTSMMIWSIADLISFITRTLTLEPGDVICTGTPHGVGVARDPQRFLNDGDEMVVEIEHVGSLRNRVRRP